MADAHIVEAKYVFLDIVGFTRDRDVEAQAECVAILNTLVKQALDEVAKLSDDDHLLLPTGDGMCIALLGRDVPFDLHMRVALGILAKIHALRASTGEEMHKFEVRIGINENADNLITDINGRRNVAGSGINVAQRVMDSGDGSQILVSTRVHENLRDRRGYRGWFRGYSAKTKHGQSVPVYQFVKEGVTGLNLDEPLALREPEPVEKKEPKLDKLVAYYLAHAIRNHSVLVEKRNEVYNDDAYIILLHSLAEDSVRQSESTEVASIYFRTYEAGSATFWEQYEHYYSIDDDVTRDLGHFIQFGNKHYLSRFRDCFIQDNFGLSDYRAASEYGRQKLKRDSPDIWAEFDLDENPDA